MFTVTLVIWVVVAAVFQNSKSNGGGKDLWGWACKDNERATVFQDEVNYDLICRLQVCCDSNLPFFVQEFRCLIATCRTGY